MGKTIAVSFEENSVKIVHASLKGNNLSIDKTNIVALDEFDSYLQEERATEFVVTCEFKESYNGVLTAPVVKSKYLKKIVESEIRKSTKKKDFSYIYTTLGERVIENKKVLEVFYFAVSSEAPRNVVERFYENGKTVKAIYPSVFSAASLFSVGALREANMGVFGTGKERVAFLTKNGAICFIRNYELFEEELTDLDIQNINMTISYCFQNIRINPSLVLLMGNLSGSSNINALSSAPLACYAKGENIRCSREIFNEFILPIASFYTPKSSNILSQDFKNINALKSYMAYASRVFIVLVILCIGFIFYEAREIASNKDSIESARKIMTDIENISLKYVAREEKISQYRSAVEFLNRSAPNIQKLLVALTEVDIKNSKIDSIEATAKNDNSFAVVINGTGLVERYSSMQTSFTDIINALGKIEGLKITDKTIDMGNKTFIIEMDYRKDNEIL